MEDVCWHHVTFVQSVFAFLTHSSLSACTGAFSAKKTQKDPSLVTMKPWQQFIVTFKLPSSCLEVVHQTGRIRIFPPDSFSIRDRTIETIFDIDKDINPPKSTQKTRTYTP